VINPAQLRRVATTHPLQRDVALAALVGGGGMIPLVFGLRPDGYQPTGADAVIAAAAFVLLTARSRAPRAVLSVTLLAAVVAVAVTGREPHVLEIAAHIALYTVVTRTARRGAAAAVAGVTAAVLYGISAIATQSAFDPENLDVIAWTGMAAALGGAVRTWREYVAAIEERATRAEATKEEEALRRVAEERLRIARELHDVIAHHIALINVQAGVASHLLRSKPDQADDALGHIRDAGRTVLDELASLLLVLRRSEDGTKAGDPAEPVPGLSRLGGLVESLTAAGLRVRHEQVGAPRRPPVAVDLAAYRIIQEGLTNAHKHGRGEARLRVEYRPDALVVQIRNPLPTESQPPQAGTGHGLTGMRERAQAVGGSLHAGADPDGTFHLDARLPLPGGPAEPGAAPRTREAAKPGSTASPQGAASPQDAASPQAAASPQGAAKEATA
jgi:signal transduction histidine kinase